MDERQLPPPATTTDEYLYAIAVELRSIKQAYLEHLDQLMAATLADLSGDMVELKETHKPRKRKTTSGAKK